MSPPVVVVGESMVGASWVAVPAVVRGPVASRG
jgi:hypothetical protein